MSILSAQEKFISNAETRTNALKQSAFFDDKLLLGSFPTILNLARKRLFTSLSIISISKYQDKSIQVKIQVFHTSSMMIS